MTFPHGVVARLWQPIEPIERGQRYEDPLQAALSAAGLGEVAGGGSQLSEKGEVQFADVEIYLADLDGALALCRAALEEAGAPEGSEFLFADSTKRDPLPIGKRHGVAIYLDGVGLPQKVYDELDLSAVLDEITTALGPGTELLQSNYGGPTETGFYFYGANADKMFASAEPTLRRIPVCQNARVVLRYGNPSLPRREVRLPLHA